MLADVASQGIAALQAGIATLQAATGADSERDFITLSAYAMLVMGAFAFVPLVLGVQAPYGKYATSAQAKLFGFQMNGKLAWFLQELPSFMLPAGYWLHGAAQSEKLRSLNANTMLLAAFLLHYTNRTFIFPMRIRGGKPTPFGVFLMAFFFCIWNG
jgi:3-oxo-5-alpha-steroid 4-dehydrogenase 1